ncbi:hypothetical protein OCH239_12685 [Roseivivax halodurans JCM 10272]|uniref:Outer membrane beta-barrel protein n=1 Tax=Roseivivax halodurans JCM 10272 TaxID=1449350 RepID=X7EDM3_9RHOB|nr:hypothetical protein [Roseivivax halodurans]ETX13228.1 hypothetical protein OCH239_12685 [Roseivivax halodurans JCM 10272]
MLRTLFLPLGAATTASLILGLPVLAQERTPDGRLLTLGLTTGITASDNVDLDPEPTEEVEATTSLSLGLLSATPTQRFELGTSAGLRALLVGDEDEDSFALDDPNGRFLYTRSSRAAKLSLEGRFDSREITSLTPLELTSEDLADLEDLQDLEDLIAANQVPRDARRLTFDLDAALETRRDSPFGITYSVGVSGERYSDAPEAFEEETRASAGLGLRFDLDEITRATTDLRFVTSNDPEEEDRFSLDLGLTRTIGTDQVGASFGIVENGDATRLSLSANAARDFSTGSVSGSLGVTRADSGNLALTGSLGLTRELSPTQDVSVDLSRRVIRLDGLEEGEPDRERAVSSLSADYSQAVTRLWRFGLDAELTQADVIEGPGGSDSFGRIGADLSRPLTEDWRLSMGVSHRFEENADGTDATSNTVSVSLNRSFRISY